MILFNDIGALFYDFYLITGIARIIENDIEWLGQGMILMMGIATMIENDMEWYLMARMIRPKNDINDRYSWNDI